MKFDGNGIPYNAPLSAAEKTQLPSGLLPSGEANYFDFVQYIGNGINKAYPSPNVAVIDGAIESGLLRSYPSSVFGVEKSGIFNYNELTGKFSNAVEANKLKIESFSIFNPYILHYRVDDTTVRIPYTSTFKVSISYDPYIR